MFFTYLKRELANRSKQTIIVAVEMALAIALVVTVTSLSLGIKDAQATSLSSVYGVGTDLSISKTQEPPQRGGGQDSSGNRENFQFGPPEGGDSQGNTDISESRLSTAPGTSTLASSDVESVQGVSDVKTATGTLSLRNTTFEGSISNSSGASGTGTAQNTGNSSTSNVTGTSANIEQVSAQGSGPGIPPEGGGAFGIESFNVLAYNPADSTVGPQSSIELSDGRMLTADDGEAKVALVDSAYATTNSLAVGDKITVGDSELEIVGIVTSTLTDSSSSSDVYITLPLGQKLADLDGKITNIYAQATSVNAIDTVKTNIESALPDTTVNTQSDLASTISGSLGTASGLVETLGWWLSAIVLVVAFLTAAMLTLSSVARRTREFGTLKALGWSNGRVIKQVAGEATVQTLLGGVAGVILGVLAVLVVNLAGINLSTASSPGGAGGPGGGGAAGAAGGGPGPQAIQGALATGSELVLHAPIAISVVLGALVLAVLGGLIAGVVGGWRVAKLSPTTALATVV